MPRQSSSPVPADSNGAKQPFIGIGGDLYLVTVAFTNIVLGTAPANRTVYQAYILTKARDMDAEFAQREVETVQEVEERGVTVFHRDANDHPMLLDYMIKGQLKEAAKMLNGADGIKAFRQRVEDYVQIFPREIYLENAALPPDAPPYIERPLRAETAQGPRVALAASEWVPAGTVVHYGLLLLNEGVPKNELKEVHLRALLDVGQIRGIGQWRTGGHGTFRYRLEYAGKMGIGQAIEATEEWLGTIPALNAILEGQAQSLSVKAAHGLKEAYATLDEDGDHHRRNGRGRGGL